MRYTFSMDDSRHSFYHVTAQTSQTADYERLHVPYGQIQCHPEVAIIFVLVPGNFTLTAITPSNISKNKNGDATVGRCV